MLFSKMLRNEKNWNLRKIFENESNWGNWKRHGVLIFLFWFHLLELWIKTPWASSRREESIDHTFWGSRWPPGPNWKTTFDPGFWERAPPSSHPWELGGPETWFHSRSFRSLYGVREGTLHGSGGVWIGRVRKVSMDAIIHGDLVKVRSSISHYGNHIGIAIRAEHFASNMSRRQITMLFDDWGKALYPC